MRKATASVDKKLIHFNSYEEMAARPGFVNVVDPKQTQLQDAVGIYHLPHDAHIPCGLSDCRTKHGLGLLMVTSEGLETNIGNRCGVKKFGIRYQVIKNQAIAGDRRVGRRDKINTALANRLAFHATIEHLLSQPRGARWLAKAKAQFEQLIPSDASFQIRKMAREGAAGVFIARLRTEREMAIQRELHSSQRGNVERYVHEQVGTLNGLDTWKTDLRELLIDELQMKMNELERVDVDELSDASLRDHAQWVDAIPSRIAQAERLIDEGAKFFQPSNLRLVAHLSTPEREIRNLGGAIDSLIAKLAKV